MEDLGREDRDGRMWIHMAHDTNKLVAAFCQHGNEPLDFEPQASFSKIPSTAFIGRTSSFGTSVLRVGETPFLDWKSQCIMLTKMSNDSVNTILFFTVEHSVEKHFRCQIITIDALMQIVCDDITLSCGPTVVSYVVLTGAFTAEGDTNEHISFAVAVRLSART
jgi:hypothetical protein